MYVMDGGNSAKRITALGDRHVSDMRNFNESDYLLPRDYVNSFANEVWHRAKDVVIASEPNTETTSQSPEEDDDNLAVTSTNVMAEDCSKNWKAAVGDDKKCMWAIFEETGIFVAACCHRFILWYADMVRSRELYVILFYSFTSLMTGMCSAKYPLAIISKVLEVLGDCTLGTYDIGCGFMSTIENSSLGEDFRKMESRMCMDAFHGYAHNYICQTKNHPLVSQVLVWKTLKPLNGSSVPPTSLPLSPAIQDLIAVMLYLSSSSSNGTRKNTLTLAP